MAQPWRARVVRALRADRTVGCLLAVVVLLGSVAVLARGGVSAVVQQISDIGAWLSDVPTGTVVHANGLSGRLDARVALHNAQGHPLKVVQDDGVVFVTDTVTGVVSRIDPAKLLVSQSVRYDTAGTQIVVGGGLAYVVDAEHGLVQQIDLTNLSAIGAPLQLPGHLGPAGVDRHGTLWVAAPAAGTLIPVTAGSTGIPVVVGRPGDGLSLTIANGTPVVTDAARATMTVVSRDGGKVTVGLPASATKALTPATTDGTLVPVVTPGANQLVVVNTATGTPTSVTLADVSTDNLGTPAVLGHRIYVPDNSTGRLVVYDSAAGQLLDQVPVTTEPGRLEVFVKDGILWANAVNGPQAACVDQNGTVHHIGKDDPRLPEGSLPTPSDSASSSPPPPALAADSPAPQAPPGIDSGNSSQPKQPATAAPARARTTTPRANPSPITNPPTTNPPTTNPPTSNPPTTNPTATQPPPPQAPRSVTETAQAGSILVTFTPVSGGGVTGYTLSGAGITPQRVPATGPYRFTVTGLSCANQYRFSVSADYPSGSATTTAAAGARPCVAPDAPRNLRFDAGTQHRIGVDWDSPGSDGGGTVHYNVSWGGGQHTGLTGTSDSITGLTNFRSYTISVAAVNPAGSSQPPATGSVALRPPDTWSGTIGNNQLYEVRERSEPTTNSSIVRQYPAGGGQSVSVVCVTEGGAWVDPTGSPSGSTWYRLTDGYVATAYVITSSGVWSCS
jgi:hypothetical protein